MSALARGRFRLSVGDLEWNSIVVIVQVPERLEGCQNEEHAPEEDWSLIQSSSFISPVFHQHHDRPLDVGILTFQV